ncbi:MAG TPA: glycosyltransferase [Pyrinomonadaceae bacterium]
MAKIIISTFGSFGDIHPYMSLAMELQSRGHNPVLATMDYYREKIQDAGLSFVPVRPNVQEPKAQEQEMIEKIMDPKAGPKFLMEEVIFPGVRESYADLLEVVKGADLLITHPAAPAGSLVGRKTGMPWISTVLAPLSFYSAYDLPVPPFWQWMSKLKLLGPRFSKLFLDTMKSQYKAKSFMTFREELGIAEFGNPMFEGQHSPTCVLALFSKVFAQPQPDWPKQTHVTGFCFYDGRHERQMSRELNAFLDAGAPPIVFTLGSSAVWVARDFFQESIEAIKRLGQRAILLIGDERNKLPSLPANIFIADYAPYQKLLPRASAVVHHGGVGTTSQALLSGVPTLIVPFAFDQSDNADHARRLGTSITIYRQKYKAATIARDLNRLLTEKSFVENARRVSESLKQENGPVTAADFIEQQLAGKRNIEEFAYASGD